MADDLGIGFALELSALGNQLVAQRLEILDDPVVDQRDVPDDVRVRIPDRRRAVGRPARVRNAGDTVQRLLGQLVREIVELALGAPPLELAPFDRADAGRVITAIFEPLEPVEQPLRDIAGTDDPNNSTHACCNSFERRTTKSMPWSGNMGVGMSRTLNLTASAALLFIAGCKPAQTQTAGAPPASYFDNQGHPDAWTGG